MEPAVAAFLQKEGLSYEWPDALLTKEKRNACFAKAQQTARVWAARFGAGSPPSLLYKSLELQLTTLFTAEALADSWLEAGVEKVYALHHGSLRTDGYWQDGALPQAVWLDLLGRRYEGLDARVFSAPKTIYGGLQSFIPSPLGSMYRRLRAFAGRGKRATLRWISNIREALEKKFSEKTVDYSCVRDAVAVFSHPKFVERDAHFIRQLTKNEPVCLFLYHPSAEQLDFAREMLKVPVLEIRDAQCGVSAALEHEIEDLLGYIDDMPTAGRILAEYIRRNNQSASIAGLWLTRLFSEYRPRLACSSQTIGVELRYFERACLDLGIPVIAVPHAVAQDTRGILFDKKDLYVSALAGRIYEDCCGDEALAIRTCSLEGLFMADEYRMDTLVPIPEGKAAVLFLYGACQSYPGLIYFDGPAERAALLRALSDPPETVRTTCAIYHKLHPAGFDMAMFQTAGVAPDSILPLSSNLADLLGKISVAVTVNYVSSPSQQAIMKDVPVIHLNTTLSGESIRYNLPIGKALRRHGAVFAFCVEEMWHIIMEIIRNGQYRREVMERQGALKPLFSPSSSTDLSRLASAVMEQPDILLRFPMRGALPGV
jgi:hypothetical protein